MIGSPAATGAVTRPPRTHTRDRASLSAAALTDERGSVTAEFAAALPAVVVALVLAVGALQASGLQIRVVDAASVAARTLGHDEPEGLADARVAELIGSHSLTTSTEGAFVCASVTAPLTFGPLGFTGLTVGARSCALGPVE